MYFVYYLESCHNNKFHYIGCTSNIELRLIRHNTFRVNATKRYAPLKLIGYKVFESKGDAFEFEKAVKKSYTLKQSFIKEINNIAG